MQNKREKLPWEFFDIHKNAVSEISIIKNQV